MKRVVIVSLVAATIAVSSGCASKSPSPVSAAAAKSLRPVVSALRTAAAGKSESDVSGAIDALDAEVSALVASNDLSPHRGQQIENAASALLTAFKAAHVPKPPPTTETDTPGPTDTPTTPGPGPTVTVTVPPTDTASADPSDSSSPKTKKS